MEKEETKKEVPACGCARPDLYLESQKLKNKDTEDDGSCTINLSNSDSSSTDSPDSEDQKPE
jgi:hypothetical protein